MNFASDDGIWTSKRLLQGQPDAVFLFQNDMGEILGDLLDSCTLIWVDNIFQYSKTFTDLLANLKRCSLVFLRRMFSLIQRRVLYARTPYIGVVGESMHRESHLMIIWFKDYLNWKVRNSSAVAAIHWCLQSGSIANTRLFERSGSVRFTGS
jgi:hypothetical protein